MISQRFGDRERFPFGHLDALGMSKYLSGILRPAGADSVLQKLSSLVRHCLEGTAQARKRVAESRDTIARRDFHLLEDRWNALARSEDERLERFLVNRPGAPQMLRQSTEAAAHRDKQDLSARMAGDTFVTAEEYLESERLRHTACLICDVHLPGMSGPDLQARLLADGHQIPIVFVTGHFSETTRARVLTAGAVGYFAKPFDPRALIGCLEKAIASIPS
jgi:CheY-like chemotaxis protein